jgi:glutamate--cysteine ligase
MSHEPIHKAIVDSCDQVEAWLESKKQNSYFPIYASVDVRDSKYKVASVDANIYPAGFNNVDVEDRKAMGPLFRRYIERGWGAHIKKIALLTEEHTSNAHYWDNVYELLAILKSAGFETRVCIPRPMQKPVIVKTATGLEVLVDAATRVEEHVLLSGDFKPDLILSNNDFSDSYDWWANGLTTPVVPARELGWYQRKKSENFRYYNEVAHEFSELIKVDPWFWTVETVLIKEFDATYAESRDHLADEVDRMLYRMRAEYDKRDIQDEAAVFIKNNAGTYGLAVTQVTSGDEVRSWNAKSRKKMQAAKGGRDVEEIIIQEGIRSTIVVEGSTAEPVVYLVGCEPAGAFYRTHSDKSANESLNSPGAVFKKLRMSELRVTMEGCPTQNVYAWAARLSLLAISKEANALGLAPRCGC